MKIREEFATFLNDIKECPIGWSARHPVIATISGIIGWALTFSISSSLIQQFGLFAIPFIGLLGIYSGLILIIGSLFSLLEGLE